MGFVINERKTKRVTKKENVYITGHSADLGYFKAITDDILNLWDCKVLINAGEIEDIKDYYAQLEQMTLVILPVTKRFLEEDNFARNTEFTYIQKKKIPVLPILVEDNLERLFDSVCGDIHLLNRNSENYTEVLNEYLQKMFGDDEIYEMIPSIFSARFFLSYRKKDRQYALQLMHLIHQLKDCEDISIWFDDFLTLGENYDEEIDCYLRESDLFLLAVTPSLLEDGNYVMSIEYPRAVELNKKIVPIELLPSNRDLLSEKYPQLPEIINIYDVLSLEKICREIKLEKNMTVQSSTEKDFLLGQAYLKGIGAEVNRVKGVNLIKKAAESDYFKASYCLGKLYYTGDGVNVDYAESIKWLEKNVGLLQDTFEKEQSFECAQALAGSLTNLVDTCMNLEKTSKAEMYLEKLEEVSSWLENAGYWGTATNMGNVWARLGFLNYQEGRFGDALSYYAKAEEKLRGMLLNSETEQSILSYARLSYWQGLAYKARYENQRNSKDLDFVLQCYELASLLYKKLIKEYRRDEQATLASVYFDTGRIYEVKANDEKNIDVIIAYNEEERKYFKWAYDVMRSLEGIGAEELAEYLIAYSNITSKLGVIREQKKEIEVAREYYEVAYKANKSVCEMCDKNVYYVEFAISAVNYAVAGVLVPNRDLLYEAYNIMNMVCQREPDNKQYNGFFSTILDRINAWPKNLN